MRTWLRRYPALACTALVAAGIAVVLASGCRRKPDELEADPGPRVGDEIVVCGRYVHTGTPVVLFSDPDGYNGYLEHCFFKPDVVMPSSKRYRGGTKRYGSRTPSNERLAARVEKDGWTLEHLREQVHLFVIHYDVCGVSRTCFRVLHDSRGLSVHFMLDLDGTIYQTLDLAERARHAGNVNSQSIGIEIANMGAYPDTERLENWYAHDEEGRPFVLLPERLGDGGIRTPGFVAHPARQRLQSGEIHGQELVQYDFTEEQYRALTHLSAAVARALPAIRLEAPRTGDGRVRPNVLSSEEIQAFGGLLGHWHLTEYKIDPGPAFQWDRVVDGAREINAGLQAERRAR